MSPKAGGDAQWSATTRSGTNQFWEKEKEKKLEKRDIGKEGDLITELLEVSLIVCYYLLKY